MCPYVLAKKSFIESPLGITNYAYFMNETTYAGKLEPRNLLVLDEAHRATEVLTNFSSVDVSEAINRSVLGKIRIKIPWGISQEEAYAWIAGPYAQTLTVSKKKLERELLKGRISESAERYERIDKHLCRVNRFVERYKPENWLLCEEDGRSGRIVSFKPIRVDAVAPDLFSGGRRVLMLSATILDKETYCRWLGLDPAEVAYMHIDCPFPVENRAIHYFPVGKMSKVEIDRTLPNMVDIVREILKMHNGSKGMIHCTNHRIARFMKAELRDARLLYSDDRNAMLREHTSSAEPTVLLSPSMTEGVDLVDDLSRFQIFLKVPFPNLGNAIIKKRLELDPKWYALETVRSIVQGTGRSVRNMDDKAETFILDSSFSYFYEKNKSIFPESFRRALEYGEKRI
jgi:Rad3-related DNA helicase